MMLLATKRGITKVVFRTWFAARGKLRRPEVGCLAKPETVSKSTFLEIVFDEPPPCQQMKKRVPRDLLKVDWPALRLRLPVGRNAEEKALRLKYFKEFDVKNRGRLSLLEAKNGVRNVLCLPVLLDAKPVVPAAFNRAKEADSKPGQATPGRCGFDTVDKCEFRMFLVLLRQFLEIFIMFDAVDENRQGKIDFIDFCDAMPDLAAYGVNVPSENLAAAFKQMDSKNTGSIDFDQFATWAMSQNLDLAEADNFDDEILHGVLKKKK